VTEAGVAAARVSNRRVLISEEGIRGAISVLNGWVSPARQSVMGRNSGRSTSSIWAAQIFLVSHHSEPCVIFTALLFTGLLYGDDYMYIGYRVLLYVHERFIALNDL